MEGKLLNGNKGAKERKKTSAIWTNFKIDKSDNKKCKHLMIHKDQFNCLLEEEKRRKEASNKTKRVGLKQETLKSTEDKWTAYNANHPRARAITYCIAEMICTDLKPFSVVSDVGFKHL